MDQRAEYDQTADTLYVHLLDVAVDHSEQIDDRRTVDRDAEGRVVGVRFLRPSTGLSLRDVPLAQVIGSLVLQSGHKFRIVE